MEKTLGFETLTPLQLRFRYQEVLPWFLFSKPEERMESVKTGSHR